MQPEYPGVRAYSAPGLANRMIKQLEATEMTHSIELLTSAAVIAAALSGPALAQGTPQTLSVMKVDPQSLATGYRTSRW